MNKKIFLILFFIIIIASVLRLWQLGRVPVSPDWDEVSLGYNAYSIMQTGRDEYDKFLPIILRSFDDYKPALYTYFLMPSIAIFGLDIFAVRLPSAIFGILTVLGTFFLVKELFKKESLALLASSLLAISPWHIQFSRIAFESNVGAALNVFWILFFIKSFKKPWFLILSALIMGLNLYMYQSEKVFIPLVLAALILIFKKEFSTVNKKYIFTSLIILAIVSLPLIQFTLTNKEAFARARGVSIFSDGTIVERNAQKLMRDKEKNDILGLILDNRRTEYAKNVVGGYLSHFDFNWLFVTGDIARHHAPNMGLMYLVELPFLLIGIYSLFVGKFSQNFGNKEKLFVALWFLLVPIPASITSGVPHAVRTLNFLPILQIFVAVGILNVLKEVSSIKYQVLSIRIKYLFFFFSFMFFMFNFSYYLNQYFVQQNYFNSKEWQYGYEKAILAILKNEEKYEKVIISNQAPLDQSYMFFLFYSKYSPLLYQRETGNQSGGFRENHQFGRYEFRPIEWEKENKFSNIFLGRPKDFSPDANVLYKINYLDGSEAIKIVGYK